MVIRLGLEPDQKDKHGRLLRAADTAPATRRRLEIVRLASVGLSVKTISEEVGVGFYYLPQHTPKQLNRDRTSERGKGRLRTARQDHQQS